MAEGRTEDQTETEQRLTVPQAAEVLGITSEAVRTRIARDTLRSVRVGGRVFVLLDPDVTQPNTEQTDDITGNQTELVDELRSRVAFLEAELERRGAAEAELRRIVAALTQRIPELEAPREPPGGMESADAPRSDTKTPPEAETGGERRPWWRRVFGG